MKKLILLLTVLATACVQAAIPGPYLIQSRPISDYVTISIGVHPVRLPLSFIKDAKISSGQGIDIRLSGRRGISITNHTKKQWMNEWRDEKTGSVSMSQIPGMLFNARISVIKDKGFRKQLSTIRQVVLHNNIDVTGYIKRKDVIIYIAISRDKGISSILLSSKKYPHMFTQISLYGLTKTEIDNNVIQGVL